ncbi:hypothetical protein [Actinokineospora xionganensis]|nr:hypothetical protein [Actinokineospora xionganensis]
MRIRSSRRVLALAIAGLFAGDGTTVDPKDIRIDPLTRASRRS